MNSEKFLRPHTASSSPDACTIHLLEPFLPSATPAKIHLQHMTKPLWCAVGGHWVKSRDNAARFASNMDAIAYCVALSLPGRIIGFDALEQELYRVDTDHIVKAFAQPQRAPVRPQQPGGIGSD